MNNTINDKTEFMRITREGVWINPDWAVDETAKAVLDALDSHIKVLVQNAVEAEREACAKLCDELRDEDGFEPYGTECAAAIRARGEI